jgi:hypothetical protein
VEAATSAVGPPVPRGEARSPQEPMCRMASPAWTRAERPAWAEPKASISEREELAAPMAPPPKAESQVSAAEPAALRAEVRVPVTRRATAGVPPRQARVLPE